MATQNEGVLKKKADMLELTLLSHQKSMEKSRVNMIKDQLRERGEQLQQQQPGMKDLHAQATTRPTFEQTFQCQMNALDTKMHKDVKMKVLG